mmetsp:Transcript_1467/g.2777  ORF Transcript_1467/g.2777 Transcript_1467/m.2777 type:complete len:112 (-) Transcript_1467:2111-2446(-)
MGVAEDDLDEVLPNRRSFSQSLLSVEDLFVDAAAKNETCSQDELNLICDTHEDDHRGGKTYGESGITNMPLFLLLIFGIIVLGGIGISCWRRSERMKEERGVTPSSTDVIL